MSSSITTGPTLAQSSVPVESLRHPETPKSSGSDTWRRAHALPAAALASAVPGGSPALRDTAPAARAAAAAVRGPAPAPATLVHGRAQARLAGTPATPAAPSPRVLQNPFECDDMMTSLSLPTSSPSLFDQVISPNDKDEVGWAIEHIAQLDPVNIDLARFHRQLVDHDPHREQQAQTAIDRFFNSEKIVPSPWSAGAERPPPQVQVTGYMESPLLAAGGGGARCDQAVQTTLSLPAALPPELEAMLAQYTCPTHAERGPLRDNDDSMLSNSTLRRKLLFHGAAAGDDVPASNDVSMTDVDGSLYQLPATPEHGHLQPASPPSRRRHVSLPRSADLESPPVSPICKSMLDSSGSELSDAAGDDDGGDGARAERCDSPERRPAAERAGDGQPEGVDREPASYMDEPAADTGYHSTLTSLPSLSARVLAAGDAGSGSGSMLTSTRLEPSCVLRREPAGWPLSSTRLDEGGPAAGGAAQPPLEATLEDDLQGSTSQQPPVPIGSSTPSRAHAR